MKKSILIIAAIVLIVSSQQALAGQGSKNGLPFQELHAVLSERIDLLQTAFWDLAEKFNLFETGVKEEIDLMKARISELEDRLDNGCIDLDSDVNNCGALGNVCAENEICLSGVCTQEALEPACSPTELFSLAICGSGHDPLDYYYLSYCLESVSEACGLAYSDLRDCGLENCSFHSGTSYIYECLEQSCSEQYLAVYGIFESSCEDGEERLCGNSEVGTCAFGTETCENNAWTGCSAILPVAEICADGLDNDCNGLVDDCPANLCGDGICDEGEPETCPEDCGCASTEEVCNGRDDNCNGLVDEELFGGLATKNAGVCSGSLLVCADGQWQEPDYSLLPGYEAEETSCDGLDNDCDGYSDEGYDTGQVCYIGDAVGFITCTGANGTECILW